MWRQLVFLSMIVIIAAEFGSDDRFLKKYALIKIFESCFGQEVVKEIRKELKAACTKCAAIDTQKHQQVFPPPQSTSRPIAQHKLDGLTENSAYANQQALSPEKVHQAILAYRPFPGPSYRPYPGSQASFYQAFENPRPYYQAPFYNPGTFFGSPYGFPVISQSYPGNARMSRDMDFKNQLDMLSSRLSGKVKNITCVMQELGYLDENLEPNYSKISERISNLPVGQELRRDIQDGVSYCQQFSQCIPEPKKEASPLSRELTKPMLFFKCYKYKKLEACIMKDVREKFSNISEEDFDAEGESRRSGKSIKDPNEVDDLASSLYDFLYGTDAGFEEDNIL